MKRIITTILLVLLAWPLCAKINAGLSHDEVGLGQTFRLILSEKDGNTQGIPNLSVLQPHFDIIATERNINHVVTNGQVNSVSQWIILLRPKKTGVLTIPAIQIGQNSSPPLSIKVKAANQIKQTSSPQSAGNQANADIKLVGRADATKPYVNQQIRYTVKFMTRKQIINSDYQAPQVEDAFVLMLGKPKSYQEDVNGETYLVEEQQYAIFPQKSGRMRIISPVVRALVYNAVPEKMTVRDKDLDIEVLAIPSTYKGHHWLPAKELSLSETYDKPSAAIKQGDTLNRTVRLQAKAIPAKLLPTLRFEDKDRGFHAYPEKATEENSMVDETLIASAEYKIAYLFSESGNINIPELKIHWFNTQTNKEEVAVLPAKTIRVIADKSLARQSASNLKPDQIKPGAEPDKALSNHKPLKDAHRQVDKNTRTAWTIALILGITWILTLMIWWRQKKTITSKKSNINAYIRQLKEACENNHPEAAQMALLAWAKSKWPDKNILNLNDVKRQVTLLSLKKEIQVLSERLYGQNRTGEWTGNALWLAFLLQKKSRQKKHSKKNPLPPMNPSS